MGLSKVYRGYVIEDINGQYYIHNAPNFTNGVPFSPGPHGGWTVATHQVDKLIEHLNRDNDRDRGKYVPMNQGYQPSYSSHTSEPPKTWAEMGPIEKVFEFFLRCFLVGVVLFFVLIFIVN